jgi:MFS family permease
MEIPMLENPELIAVETPTTVPNVSNRVEMAETNLTYGTRSLNLRNSGDWQEQRHLYGNGQDIDGGNVRTYSSGTLDSQTPSVTAQQKPESNLHEIALIATICAAHFLTQAGLAQSIAPMPIITKSLATSTHVPSPSWYSAAYSLTVGTFILPSGRLGDIYGVKRLFVIGWLWFALSSLGAGFNPPSAVGHQDGSSKEIFFCFCRAMQGIGPALLMPNGLGILGRRYEDGNRKNMAFALFGASAPVGFVVGSVMSSLLAEKAHWSWAYWVQAVACAVTAMMSMAIVPHFPGIANQEDDTTKTPMWKQLDVPGSILGVSALILINVALNQAPLVSWSTPYTYFLLIIGLIILGFFFIIEFSTSLTPHPLIPLATLSFDTCFVLACIACGWGSFGIWIFYLWDFLESLRDLSPLLASAQFAPAAISGLLAAVTTGFLLSKTTPQVIMVLSMFAFFIGTTLIATAPVEQVYWAQAFFSIIVMPWGMDMSFPSATILLSSKVGPENQGVAMSLVNTVVNYSISVGLGLAGTVQSLADKDGTQTLKGFKSAWYFGMGLSGTGIVIAVFFIALTMFTIKNTLKQKEEIREF